MTEERKQQIVDDAIYNRLRAKGWPDNSPPDEVEQLRAALGYHLPFLKGPRHLGLCTSRTVAQWAITRGESVVERHPVVANWMRVRFTYCGETYEMDVEGV